jgi:hypothetical protein
VKKEPAVDPLALADLVEREAFRALAATDRARPEPLGIGALELAGALLLRSRHVPHVLFNRILLAEAAPDAVALVESAVGRLRAQGIARFFVQVPSGPTQAALYPCLRSLALVPYPRAWHKLLGPIARIDPVPTSFEIAPAVEEELSAVGRLLARCFELPEGLAPLLALACAQPGFFAYVAREPSPPTSAPAAALLAYEHGTTVYLMFVATDPAFRGRGALAGLLARALRDSAARGCTLACAETGAPVPGERNPAHDALVRAGLTVAQVRENWAPAGTSWARDTVLSRRAR